MADSEEAPQCPCCRVIVNSEPIVDEDSSELPTKSQARPAPETPEDDDYETQPRKDDGIEITEPRKPCYSKLCPKDPIIVLDEQPAGKHKFLLCDRKDASKTTLSDTIDTNEPKRYQQERESPIFGEQTVETVKNAFDVICKKSKSLFLVMEKSNVDVNENSTENIAAPEANKKIDFVEVSSPNLAKDVITVIENTKSTICTKLNSALEKITQNLPEQKDIFSIKDRVNDQPSNYDVPVIKSDLMTPTSSNGVLKQIKSKISSFFGEK
ncbi:hypothetical protein JYU34_020004 [Plutella xylostella]|uniref:Uncharacterized protein n=1 Tax=Plutella xylostella TaxID=51655 RepID=A0ABQ7PZI7_PLUXY|nr:hypothetical protein JYU34_020004 [Plutella xylostella]